MKKIIKTDYNAKITEIESKILSITGLATPPATVEIKTLDVTNLVKKTDYDAETWDIKSKYFTAADYNTFINKKLDLKMKQKELVDKSATVDLVKNAELDRKSSNISNKGRTESRTR